MEDRDIIKEKDRVLRQAKNRLECIQDMSKIVGGSWDARATIQRIDSVLKLKGSLRQVECIDASAASAFQPINQLSQGVVYEVLDESETHYKLKVDLDPKYPNYDGWFKKRRFNNE